MGAHPGRFAGGPVTVDEAIAKTRFELNRESSAMQSWMAQREPTRRRLERVASHYWCTARGHQAAVSGLACDVCTIDVRHALTAPTDPQVSPVTLDGVQGTE